VHASSLQEKNTCSDSSRKNLQTGKQTCQEFFRRQIEKKCFNTETGVGFVG